ncbi:MAG: DUF340 domain-containing protein [Lachnospiraceae bacterium]|nr:DUF340 domain-containing protein [Lachnospiraceae bacterium]
MNTSAWLKKVKCLALVSAFALIGNYLSTMKAGKPVTPIQALPGMAMLLAITIVGSLITEVLDKVLPKNLPAIAYISLLAIIVTIPGVPGAEFASASMGKIGLLPLCTPILAYAGISLGKDLDTFKKQGVSIVIVALLTFVGTYVGSAIIAEIVLRATGVI